MQETKARRVSRNTLSLYATEAISRLVSLFLTLYLTRRLGVEAYGQYSLLVNWTAIFASFGDLGLNVLTIREVANRRSKAGFYLRNVIVLRFLFSTVFFLVLVGLGFVLGYESTLKMGLAIMGGRLILDATAGGYVYLLQAHERMAVQGAIVTGGTIIRFIGAVVVLESGGGVVAVCGSWIVASFAAALVLTFVGRKYGWKAELGKWNISEGTRVLKQALPLATLGALVMLYYRVDSVMLKSLAGNQQVGLYNAAYRLLEVTLLLSQLFGLSLLPVLSSTQKNGEAFARIALRSLKILAFLAFPITVGGVLLARPLVTLFFGGSYLSAGPIFAMLCCSIIPFFLANIYMNVLTIRDPKRLVLLFTVLLFMNIALNFILIPSYGPEGSAAATVICEWVGMMIGFVLVRGYLRVKTNVRLTWPITASILSALAMGACIYWDPRLYWLALGPILYFAGLWTLQALGPDDIESLRGILKRKSV